MTIVSVVDRKLTAEEFDAWYEAQPHGRRYEFMDGIAYPNFDGLPDDPYAQGERVSHAEKKLAIAVALREQVRMRRLPCQVFGDGMKVQAGDARFEPDAQLRCGPRLPGDIVIVPDPLIVVEVTSPSTKRVDPLAKLTRYFDNPALMHYLIVLSDERRAIHHHRTTDGRIESLILSATDNARFDPPGVEITMADVFGPEEDAEKEEA